MLTKEAVERRRVALATGDAVGALRPLVKSATDVGRALGQLAVPTTPEESAALADARQALVGLGDLALGCPAGSRDNQRFLGWIGEVVERVRNTPRGRSLLLPGGWCTKAGGHPMVYVVRRHDTHFSLAVTNTGDGLEYHPQEADPILDGFRAMHTVLIDDIDPGTLMDGSSWALLYRPLIFPAPGKRQSEMIYGKVLPFLNKRPLMASVGPRTRAAALGGASDAVTPIAAKARGGDASGARLALEAARFCVASSHGVSPRRADALVEMGVRHVFLEQALQDLGQVPGEQLAAAPAAALECACRALATAAGPHADALADATPEAAARAGAEAMRAAAVHAAASGVVSAGASAAAGRVGGDGDPFAILEGANNTAAAADGGGERHRAAARASPHGRVVHRPDPPAGRSRRGGGDARARHPMRRGGVSTRRRAPPTSPLAAAVVARRRGRGRRRRRGSSAGHAMPLRRVFRATVRPTGGGERRRRCGDRSARGGAQPPRLFARRAHARA